MRNSLVVAAWNLADSGGAKGGFICFPVSHKANMPLPLSAAQAPNGGQNHRLPPGCICPEAPAGSITFFTEALVHGTVQWDADHDRRVLLYKYSQKHIAQGPDAVRPSAFSLTPRQQRLFSSPQQRSLAQTFHPMLTEEEMLRREGKVQESTRRQEEQLTPGWDMLKEQLARLRERQQQR